MALGEIRLLSNRCVHYSKSHAIPSSPRACGTFERPPEERGPVLTFVGGKLEHDLIMYPFKRMMSRIWDCVHSTVVGLSSPGIRDTVDTSQVTVDDRAESLALLRACRNRKRYDLLPYSARCVVVIRDKSTTKTR